MRAILVTLRFNPAHLAHIPANAKLLEESGYEVYFHWHNKFNELTKNKFKSNLVDKDLLKQLKADDLFIVWYSSLGALLDVLYLKLTSKAKCIFIYHEPLEPISVYYKAGFTLIKIVKILLTGLISLATAFASDKVIVSSEKALLNVSNNRFLKKKPRKSI